MDKTVSIPDDFTKYTGLRYKSLTPGASGEEFRDLILIPTLDSAESVTVILDGNISEYLPSFLEECFGGLIRIKRYTFDEFCRRVRIVSDLQPQLIEDIQYYVKKETDK